MEPIPETIEVIDEFGPFADYDLVSELLERSTRVMELVPDCVGLSVASRTHGVTLTLVATEQEVIVLDALRQMRAGRGSSPVAVEAPEMVDDHVAAVIHEGRWQRFAQATAAAAVASSLTMPILVEGEAVGSVDLYAAAVNGFTGLHEQIAQIFHAWAPGAVTNADLSFSTREAAKQAPRELREDLNIHVAVGILAASERLRFEAARQGLSQAAQRGQVSEAEMAASIIARYRCHHGA